jgi:outer membrane protein assembly factor BamE
MLRFLAIVTYLFLFLSSTGCTVHKLRVDQGVLIDQESIAYLQEGLTQEQVRKLLGPAANISSFQNQRWEYVFQSTQQNFAQDKIKKLVLHFDPQGYLKSWSADK